jgi:alpha-galactosidase
VTQPGSTYLAPDRQSHLLIDYNIALCDVFKRFAASHPDVMGMACAGGGGRADFGAMRYFHSFWASDNTDPRARVFIQWGFGHFFPACAVCAHVTRMGDRPLKFAIDVAMSLSMGLDIDVNTFSPEERHQLAAAVKLYKTQLRPIVQQGDLYRLESPYEHPRAAMSYVSADRCTATLFVYQITDGPASAVKPRGLDPTKHYRVREVNIASSDLPEDGRTIDGATLMHDGVHPSCQREFDSSVILFSAEH